MKNKDLDKKDMPKLSEQEKAEHRLERNRRKRYHSGEMTLRAYLGKPKKTEVRDDK